MSRKKVVNLCTFFMILIFSSTLLFGQNGRVAGKITDNSGSPLPGANIVVTGSNIGAAANVQGEYVLSNVPTGSQQLEVSYIGYQKKTVTVTIEEGDVVNKDLVLERKSIEGQEVEISAQARGQTEAINQQVASENIKNVVSQSKIRELPESNAAEAVGRLPGVSLKRSGGEGNKVVIRGLSPEYSKIQIDGVTMAATGQENRSVDLSMISPYMLSGIDVSKSAMADQDASQHGGIVNFKLREAPEEPRVDMVAQGGYNQLEDDYGNYKFAIGGSRRFFDDKFGIFLQGNMERRNRSSETVDVGYEWYTEGSEISEEGYPYTNNVSVSKVNRIVNRQGGVLVMDYKTPSTKIVNSNFYSMKKSDATELGNNYGPNPDDDFSHEFSFYDYREYLSTITNKLRIEKIISDWTISSSVSYSKSETDVPEIGDMGIAYDPAFGDWTPKEDAEGGFPPNDVTDKVQGVSNQDYYELYLMHWDEYISLEENMEAKVDITYDYNLSDYIDGNIKVGGHYRHKYKNYDYSSNKWEDYGEKVATRNALKAYFEDTDFDNWKGTYLPGDVLLEDRTEKDMLNGEFEVDKLMDQDLTEDFVRYAEDTLAAMGEEALFKDHHRSDQDDYWGNEDYYAGYIKPTINIGEKFSFIPGFRYEKNNTEYTAIRGSTGPDARYSYRIYDSTTTTRENEFLLPMIQAKYKATDWLNIQAAYTNTLSRPSYTQFIPKQIYYPNGGYWDYSNPYLEPSKSQNIDLHLSVYSDKAGLFTIGGFHKSIEDLVFYKSITLVDSSTFDKYNIDMPINESTKNNNINAFFNNPNETTVYGIETEYQSNFWFLPGALSDIVLNINYTRAFSESNYPKGVPIWEEKVKETAFGTDTMSVITGTNDTSFTARMIDQPNHSMNLSLGYDYKGFTIRGSMQYKSDVFTSTHFHDELRSRSAPLTMWDVKIKQQLPVEGLRLFANFKNITSPVEKSENGTDYYTQKHYYGMNADIGIRYIF